MRQYWTMLGSLLSTVEVGAWVEHAVQMPRDVAQLFLETSVSGYDFAELAHDTSESGALKTEVGVRTQRQRNTLARAMRMRLTGVGRVPTSASPLTALGPPKCTSVHLAWTKADGGGFPIHKYLVERRATASQQPGVLDATHSGCSSCTSDFDAAWKIVASGHFHEFLDESLLPGIDYDYRVAAWNAIGRGDFATAHVPITARTSCNASEYLGTWAIFHATKVFHSSLTINQLAVVSLAVSVAILMIVYNRAQPIDFHVLSRVLARHSILRRCISSFVPKKVARCPGEAQLCMVAASKRPWPPGLSATEPAILCHGELTSVCSTCEKPFITCLRSRHYCYICAISFCKMCGTVRHSHMITCPVGSRCCCSRCAHDAVQVVNQKRMAMLKRF
mmetsp:Transcript_25338/g.79043  ORF Transcript_25338/g.79043 Transcript_25338/m.79043 type:complete len:391 (-) Transcript_25338:338-1510(-)